MIKAFITYYGGNMNQRKNDLVTRYFKGLKHVSISVLWSTNSPLVEGSKSTLPDQLGGTLREAAEGPWIADVPRLDHVHRGGNCRGHEPGTEPAHHVAREAVLHPPHLYNLLLDHVICDQLTHTSYTVPDHIGNIACKSTVEIIIDKYMFARTYM